MNATLTNPTETTNAPRSLASKLKIPAIIFGIVALEWLLAFLIMPGSSSPPQVAPVAAATVTLDEVVEESPGDGHATSEPAAEASHDAHGASGHGHAADAGHGDAHAGKAAPKLSDADEVDLGSFTVSGFQPASNSTLFITFHLYGTVKHKYVREFHQRLEENQHRIRDNIIVIIRSAEITDLTDAGLGLIKRRILETTNRSLGKPLLQEVVFSEFSFIEQ